MACAGIDFGNKTSVVAIARRGGIDICCNEVSNRATPTIVSFQGAERHMGESAASIAAQNHRNTVASIQRLLGLPHANKFAMAEASRLTCTYVPHPQVGTTAVQVSYSGVDVDSDSTDDSSAVFSFQQLMAMLFGNLMQTASNEYKAPVRDLVISVPVYYTEGQRRALLDAATIANVNCLRVINEHAAIALSYGIFRTKDLPDKTPIKVAFVDIGEASTTVSIAAFTNTRCDVLAVATDPCLGGRDLDDILVNKFAAEFKQQLGIDVLSKPKPAARLRKECEKLKKVLSTNPEVRLNIECLMNDIDVKGSMKRDDLEQVAAPMLDRIRALCEQAIANTKLADGEKLAAVEIVGGSTRVPSFKKVIAETFEKIGAPLRTTLNADECIARGCALMSAMISPAFRVRDYVVSDIATYALVAEKVYTNGTAPESLTLVPNTNAIPCVKAITFKAPGPLTLNIRYKDPQCLPGNEESGSICSYLINSPLDDDAKVRAKIRVTANSTVELAGAQLMKEVEVEEEVVVKKPAADKPNGNASSTTDDANAKPTEDGTTKDTPMPDANKDVSDAEMKDANQADKEMTKPDAADETKDEHPAPVEAPAPEKKEEAPVVEKRLVKKTKTTDLEIKRLPGIGHGLTTEIVVAATEKEAKMKANDLYIKERSEAMNSLEAYVYDLRSRLDDYTGDLKEFGPENIRDTLKKDLDESEDWIYSEEAEKASKSAFVEKKRKLVDKANPLIHRKREFEERPVRIKVLEASIDNYKQILVPDAEPYAHIVDEEKKKVQKCVEDVGIWLKGQIAKQEKLAKDVDPVLTCSDLNSKLNEVDKVCRPIQNTPKPKPKTENKTENKDKTEDDAPTGCCSADGKSENAEPVENGTTRPEKKDSKEQKQAPPASEKMEMDGKPADPVPAK